MARRWREEEVRPMTPKKHFKRMGPPVAFSSAEQPVRASSVQGYRRGQTESPPIISGSVEDTDDSGIRKQIDLTLEIDTKESVTRFVRDACDEVHRRRNARKGADLRQALQLSRDQVLQQTTPSTAGQTRLYPRLPSNGCPPTPLVALLYCQPCRSDDESSSLPIDTVSISPLSSIVTPKQTAGQDEKLPFFVRMRGIKNKTWMVSLPEAIPLEGTQDPLPPSTATIFLKTHYATEDEQNLAYVPYFGDDDKEDVVSELYNLEGREKMMEFGPECHERDSNDAIDEILSLIHKRLDNAGVRETHSISQSGTPKRTALDRRIHKVLANILNEDVDRIRQRYLMTISSAQNDGMGEREQTTNHRETYLDVMDTYRPLFCRRCFSYDCNIHGNLSKPSLELQAELAVQREMDGFWENENDDQESDEDQKNSVHASGSEDDHGNGDKKNETALAIVSLEDSSDRKRTVSDRVAQLDHLRSETTELSHIQKIVCERAFLIFQGNIDEMALAMRVPRSLVADFVSSKGMELKNFEHVRPEVMGDAKRKKRKGENNKTSMKNYNVAWLKRVEDAEIHPFFVPCDHDGPCSDENCSCVKNAFFCTKHCVWGEKSRNFFRGCACKGGKCCTKSCACFAAKRECDPDLCRTCGACVDPPNKPATRQRCRNDNIGMRRHCHLLLAKSSIEDAGWGIYTKHALRKGDFVHEYVGEVISQEEAERRGRIYDKVNRSYLFNLCSDYVVDASRKGNKTRFANHSSKPNCETKMVSVNGDIRIGLFAREDIEPQSELFFDYRYDVGIENDLITKPGMRVAWQDDPSMANQISVVSKKHT